jgi:hypothetical protein
MYAPIIWYKKIQEPYHDPLIVEHGKVSVTFIFREFYVRNPCSRKLDFF